MADTVSYNTATPMSATHFMALNRRAGEPNLGLTVEPGGLPDADYDPEQELLDALVDRIMRIRDRF